MAARAEGGGVVRCPAFTKTVNRNSSHSIGPQVRLWFIALLADSLDRFSIAALLQTILCLVALAVPVEANSQQVRITVQADQPGHRISRYLTGACIEDVNHEIYGGLYSQMIFGESFQEPPPSVPPRGFKAFGGRWSLQDGELKGSAGEGPKLVSEWPGFADGEAGVELSFPDRTSGNAGLIVRVSRAGQGADGFDGYEISLDAAAQILRLGRHRQNWEPVQDTPCDVPTGQWIPLVVKLAGRVIEVQVGDRTVIRHEDGTAALPAGAVGLRQWQREARYRNLWVKTGDEKHPLLFEANERKEGEVSGMWRLVQRGNATGTCALEQAQPFAGVQSQRLTFSHGEGEFGLENEGLNRWGMYFVGGKSYEGILCARAEEPTTVWVALERADGTKVHAERPLRLKGGGWQRLELNLTPKSTEAKGRFALKLKRAGTVTIGYAFLQPGRWGRFKSLPVRRDVAEALVDQGITLLRYGGSMVNHAEYRWKKMIGPRDRRPPYHGTWYPYSSNGWGILDFMDFCEAAGIRYIPAFNADETPQDMADFIEYAKGPPDSAWGRRRVTDGHRAPYHLRYLELGNEERVDAKFAAQIEALAKAIWAKDTNLILVVGDFAYSQPIRDPFDVRGAAGGLGSLAGQQRILQLAKEQGREVWFDVHVGTEGPRPDATFDGMFSFRDILEKVAAGARHHVAVFEFNAGNHTQRRALANAFALLALERDGRILFAASANGLQPDGQNDNGWDQGLLFLNPAQVWLQPPGWVTCMVSKNYQPLHVPATVEKGSPIEASAKCSEDGRTLVLQVVNGGGQPVSALIGLQGFVPAQPTADIEELAGPLEVRNTADNPYRLAPRKTAWRHGFANGTVRCTFPAHSFTVLKFR